jgi:hypothetical protein
MKRRSDRLCGFSDWTLHDLRRTFSTNVAKWQLAPLRRWQAPVWSDPNRSVAVHPPPRQHSSRLWIGIPPV